ncbi:hypothetical protein BDV95DRAFT_162631 [Massariosphaeria phaeospora]|uniref:DUF8004 domain-containing protein n=1 Tax=Massariosphaeria phaeospora TaxID=100035 RepID=A0A7C8M7B1_9PLEO|nr:hypothetical protein BDV95DRAFT_162631 [Massariosphaeria phaeospora]
MTMALSPPSSRASAIPANTPRIFVPGRTSSLQHFGKTGPAKISIEVPTVPQGATPTLRPQSLTAMDGSTPGLLKGDSMTGSRTAFPSNRPDNVDIGPRRSASCSVTTRNPTRAARVKRWVGSTRTVSDWDGLRRDPELWYEDGDCYVHLYARGHSQRGPSFCVPFRVLRESKCGSMFSLCFAQITPAPGSNSPRSKRISSGLNTPVSSANTVELYIPAPDEATREAAFQWHITTRNFFAYILNKPLVGNHMGQSLMALQERMQLFRSGQIDNFQDLLLYAEQQGYRDLVDCPDYALAMLFYAEHYKLRDIWIDAFAHCVGMNNRLSVSKEFEPVSRLTKALITRACLEMDIQLGRVTSALGNFLEDDLSPAFLGVPQSLVSHLDRMRTFLHGFYVEKFGYWPPPKGTSYSKALYRSMFFDFKFLYDYLVDLESTTDISSQKPASGGLCVLQNVRTFDERHQFAPLAHPLPLLPENIPLRGRTQSQKTLRTFTLGSKQAKTDHYLTARSSLVAATNFSDDAVTNAPIVKAYMRFERQCALSHREEKVSMADARKVRWLLIYGTLQYLMSALRAPKEVRDANEPTYPLCCLVTESSPWQIGTKALNSPTISSTNIPETIDQFIYESGGDLHNQPTLGPSRVLDIRPDDCFTHTNLDIATPSTSRPVSVEVPAPLRISSPARNSSIRSFRRLSVSSLSSRRNSVVPKSVSQPFCEIIVHGYGNGLNEAVGPTSESSSHVQSVPHTERSVVAPSTTGLDASFVRPSIPDSMRPVGTSLGLETTCEPNHDHMYSPTSTANVESAPMKRLGDPTRSDSHRTSPSYSDSTSSTDSRFWSDEASSTSSISSTHSVFLERTASGVEDSGLLGGFISVNSAPLASRKRLSSAALFRTASRCNEFRFSFNSHNAAILDLEPLSSYPESVDVDSTIGVALSAPPAEPSHPPPPPPISLTSEEFSSQARLSRSLSVDTVTPNDSTPIFPALSMGPPPEPISDDNISARSGSESSQSVLDAIPPPIMRVSPRMATQVNLEKPIEDEKVRKKEKRKSFWRR